MAIGVQQFPILSPEQESPTGNLLQNALQKYAGIVNASFLPRQNESKLQASLADAMLKHLYATMPFGGKSLPGAAGDILGLDTLKQHYGENSPEYKAAINQFNLGNESTNSRIKYQNKLTDTLPLRALTQEGKGFVEQSNVNQGASPAGTPIGQSLYDGAPPYNPNLPNNAQGQQYGLKRIKENVPAKTAERNLFATNIEKTLGNINPDDLTQFAGVSGFFKRKLQEGLASVGKESKGYDNYLKSVTAANLLAKQVRQFYGDSIQPEIEKKLANLSNPQTWSNNPKLAKELFNQFTNILGQETGTYRSAIQDPSVYLGQGAQSNGQNFPQQNMPSNDSSIMPSLKGFSSKEEFQGWYAKQSPEVREAVKRQLNQRGQ
jgi:hypothetical protein